MFFVHWNGMLNWFETNELLNCFKTIDLGIFVSTNRQKMSIRMSTKENFHSRDYFLVKVVSK